MKVVAIVSGGMDSTTLLYHLRDQGHVVKGLGFDYGQRHSKELDCAREICKGLLAPFDVVDVKGIGAVIAGQSALVNDEVEVPDGHYADESMKQTVVPNRNMIMLSVAIGHAIALEFDAVAYGAHAGDHTIYPDCRPSFAAAVHDAARLCDWRPIELLHPFINKTKTDIAAIGGELRVPFELTWSCYKGGAIHCGTCGTCVERREAFREAGVEDRTIYAGG